MGLGLAGSRRTSGAGVMCYAPDPTLLTKVGCVVVGTHSMDSIKPLKIRSLPVDHLRQILTSRRFCWLRCWGRRGYGLQRRFNGRYCRSAGVCKRFRRCARGCLRVGQLKLLEHESIAGAKGGGHTIAKHVAKSSEELLERLAKSPGLQSASTFTDLRTAEYAISRALRVNHSLIKH